MMMTGLKMTQAAGRARRGVMRHFAKALGAMVPALMAIAFCVAANPGHGEDAKPDAPYQAMSETERARLQSDLTWAGFYNGAIDGNFGAGSLNALKAFQKSINAAQSGVLDPADRDKLAKAAREKHSFTGWAIVTDPVNGIRLGIPQKLAPRQSKGASGAHWQSAQGQIQIETWRLREAGLTIAGVAAREGKANAKRQTSYQVIKSDFFVLSGLQGLKKFYVRGQIRNGEVRGLTILYDQATEGVMDPVVIAMASAFTPFPGDAPGGARPPRRKVEYASGVVAGTGDVVLTASESVAACHSISVPGLGAAERLAEDGAHGAALLRVYGGARGTPFDSTIAAPSQTYRATGIADPQSQKGGSAISQLTLKAETKDGAIVLTPPPGLGFSGAAVSGDDGRFAGLMVVTPATIGGPADAAASEQALLVPAATVRELLSEANVPLAGQAGSDIKASIVRVICVRR